MIEPRDLLYAIEDRTRQSGRTTALVKSVPTTGCIIFVHNRAMVEVIRRMMAEHRPDVDIKTVKILICSTRSDAADKIRGIRIPVYVDHVVLWLWSIDDLEFLNQGWNREANHCRF